MDTSGLLTTVGFQTKGECVSVSFKPPFFYDLSTHDISPPQIPIHTIKYLDGAEEEKCVNLLGREFFVSELPSHGEWGDRVRKQISYFCAYGVSSQEVKSFLKWVKAQLSMNGRMLSGSVLSEAEVKRLLKQRHGRDLLCDLDFKFNDDGTVSWTDLDSNQVQVLLSILQDFNVGKLDETMAVETKTDTEPTRNQTVLIVIPEGFPPELFFEEVEEHLRHALSQADPLVAPASGHLGDPYKWPDRGFDHEEAWYESLMTALAEVQTGAIARGQTQYEAETLVSRLSSVVQCRIMTDDSQDYTLRAREVKRSQGGAGSGLTIGDRVQVSTGEKEWVTGTLLMVEDANRFGVIADDGSWLSLIPQDHIKGLRNAGRSVGNRRALAPDIHELMVSHVRDARMLEQLAVFTGAQTRPIADLRRKFSCFEVGDINRDGYTAPKRRLEMWNSNPVSMQEDFGQTGSIPSPPKPLRIEFDIPQQGGEMIKVKTTSQLASALDKSKSSFVGVLVVDAQARPPSGQSWPPPIKSASSLVKSLAQRFGNGKFLRILSGTTPECLDQLGIPRSNFQPHFILYASGEEEGRWQQNKQFELIWEPCPEQNKRSDSPSTSVFLNRTIHRNEFASLIERAIDAWYYDEKLRSPSSSAIESYKTVHQSLQGNSTGEVTPSSYILHYSLRFPDGDIDDWCRDLFEMRDEDARRGRRQHAMNVEDCETTRDVWKSDTVQLNDPVRQALDVVKLLYNKLGKFSGSQKSWQSLWLTKRLSCQLQDALSFASCSLPAWCMSIPRVFPFLFSLDARQRLLDCCGFGSSHAVYRFQEWKVAAYRNKHADSMRSAQQQLARAREQQDIDGISRATDDLDDIERRMYNKRIGAIASDLARVARGNILDNAMRLFDVHHASKHLLEVQFHEEDGFGSGVTQNFYEAVSVALQVRKLNHENKLWISDGHDAEYAMDPEGPFKYLTNPDGLFPQPLPEDAAPELASSLEKQFRFMGRLFAKACRDKFTVPLPLHPHFFRTLQNVFSESPRELLATFNKGREALLPSDDWTSLHLVDAYCAIVSELKARCANVNSDQIGVIFQEMNDREFMASYLNRSYECSLGQFWESSEAKFVDPLTKSPLCSNGASIELTVENLERYVELVADLWFSKGIRRQMSAFKEGINDVFPFSALQIFSASEIELMLCGERVIEWDKASLEQHFKLVSNEQGSRYTKESVPVQLLLEELVAMSNSDRARFLDFVTACPRLPPGGLASLSIEIAPETRSRYPRSRTCSKLMWLPAYSSQAELREHLRAALINAKEGGFHEHNEALVLTNVRPAGDTR
uniref:HECT domain-containing protein n=1 Tax=Hanusia phi TaxID=3032 RepID=A0A7S0H648_9CRYP